MAIYEVYSHPELRRYKTSACSKATYFQIITFLLTFIPPLFIAYRSHGFWQKTDTYQEQPDVKFKHQILVILETHEAGKYVTWSTYQNYNQLQQKNLRVPLVKSREEDENGDGKYDALHLTLQMPLLDTEHIQALKLLLTFDYKMSKFSFFQMESLAYVQHSSPVAGSQLEVVGDLRWQQRAPLAHRGRDTRFNTSIIDSTSIFASAFDLGTIFSSYTKRNASTLFENKYPLWKVGRGAGQPFLLKATVRYPEENIIYTPGFWQLIKWGWVQYVPILLVFIFVINRIRLFVFQHQIITTIVERPFKTHQH